MALGRIRAAGRYCIGNERWRVCIGIEGVKPRQALLIELGHGSSVETILYSVAGFDLSDKEGAEI